MTNPSTSDMPVVNLLADMTRLSVDATSLDLATLMLVRIAALAAVDAPPTSYLANLGAAADLDIDADQVTGVLTAIAPIIGTARVAAAAGHMLVALAAAVKIDELREVAGTDAD
jgi:4-carboxymuconolactone decarboxylase